MNRELLLLIINKIDESVTPKFSTIVEDIEFNLLWSFPVLLFALYEAYKLEIYNVKIDRMIKQWITNFEVYMPYMNINRIYLATTLSLLLRVIPDKRLEKQIKLLLYSADFEILKTLSIYFSSLIKKPRVIAWARISFRLFP